MPDPHPDDAARTVELEERIKKLLLAQPFVPFEVVLKNGQRYVMPRPFSLAIGPRSMAPAFRPKGSPSSFQKDQISEVRVLNQSAA